MKTKNSVVVTDVDGCLTDGKVCYTDSGERYRAFSVIDGHGFRLLEENKFHVIAISGENDECIKRRMNKIGVPFVHTSDKKKFFDEFILPYYDLDDIYYLGDDMLDLVIEKYCGYFATPKNSWIHKRFKDKYPVLESSGGDGAFREFAESVLEINGIISF